MSLAPSIGQAAALRQFRERREPDWLRLEAILRVAESRSLKALSDEDLLALPVLYRAALSSLSVARETVLDLALITYLEGLCARAYFFVYGVRSTPGSKLGDFFRRDWPDAVRHLWRETIAACLLLLVGGLAGYLLVSSDPSWYAAFIDPELAGGRDFSASREDLRRTLYHEDGGSGLSFFATFLFTHNAQVSLLCFALGFAFGIPTALLLVQNGAMIGAIFALFASHGLAAELGGWLIIHGSTELLAIALAGAAGFRIGWSIVFSGDEPRLAAAARAGRGAARAMVGVLLMLVCAGVLEGLGRQLVTTDVLRYLIGITMLLLWLGYFYAPRRRVHG